MAGWQDDPGYLPTNRQKANTTPRRSNWSKFFTHPPHSRPARWADVYRMRTAGKGWVEISKHLGLRNPDRALQMYRRAEQIIAYGPTHIHFKHFLEFVPAEEPQPIPEPLETFVEWSWRVLDSYREALSVGVQSKQNSTV